MNLYDTPEEQAFRGNARAWIVDNVPLELRGVRGTIGRVDEARFLWSRRLSEAGYAGLTWPEEYGGAGRPYSYQAILYEELARAEAPSHIGVIGLGMAGPTIIAYGTPEQKQLYLSKILSAENIWCQGFSEPEAGSDLAAVKTTASLDTSGSFLTVNGQKVWSSFAQMADYCILLARNDPAPTTKHEGMTYLIVDMRAPGIEVRPLRQITGEAEFNEIFFSDVRVPRANVLGEIGDGWKVAMTTLLHERATLGFLLAAQLEVAVRKLVALAREAAPDDPLVWDRVAREWIEFEALRYANYRSLTTLVRTGAPGPEGSLSKLQWSEANQRVTKLALDLLGLEAQLADEAGNGYWQFEQLRSRGNTIEAGTSEVLRNIIAERVLGLPRSR